MDKEYYDALAKVRLKRAKELLEEAIGLMETLPPKIIRKLRVQNKFEMRLIMMIFMSPAKRRQES